MRTRIPLETFARVHKLAAGERSSNPGHKPAPPHHLAALTMARTFSGFVFPPRAHPLLKMKLRPCTRWFLHDPTHGGGIGTECATLQAFEGLGEEFQFPQIGNSPNHTRTKKHSATFSARLRHAFQKQCTRPGTKCR